MLGTILIVYVKESDEEFIQHTKTLFELAFL